MKPKYKVGDLLSIDTSKGEQFSIILATQQPSKKLNLPSYKMLFLKDGEIANVIMSVVEIYYDLAGSCCEEEKK